MDSGTRAGDTPLHQALREALGKLPGQCRLLWKTGLGHHQKVVVSPPSSASGASRAGESLS